MEFIDPAEDATDYVAVSGERWECPCGGGFASTIKQSSSFVSTRTECPHCGATVACVGAEGEHSG